MLRLPATPTAAACSSLPDGLMAGGFAFEVAMAAAGDGPAAPPEWIQLTPRGPVTARDGRPFSFDPEKLAAASAREGLRLPIDFAHESDYVALLGAKPARGWITALEARPEGLFGRVEWLPDAVAALTAKSYRYISPTFWLEGDKRTARLMKGAALVTSPALGMPALAASTPTSTPPGERPMKNLLAKLGLTENATEDEALAKLSALTTPDPAAYAPMAQLSAANAALADAQKKLADIEAAAETAKCQALIDQGVSDGRIAPAARAQFLAMAQASYAAASAAIAAMPALLAAGADKTAKDAEAGGPEQGALSPEELGMASALGLSADAYKAAKAA
jgi:phage I-like protein